MTDKFYLKEVCGEYKFYEKGDAFPLTEKQILNKLNENEQLKNENAKMKKELSLLAEFNQKAINMNEKQFESLDDDFCLVDGKIFVKFARIFKLIEDADSLESLEAICDADLDYTIATYLEPK